MEKPRPRNLDARRDTPETYRDYMRKNPFYWQDLNRPLAEVPDGCVALWAKVVEQALESAAAVPKVSGETIQEYISTLSSSPSISPGAKTIRTVEMKRVLDKVNQIERDKRIAISFLEGPMFSFACQECDINPELALKAVHARIAKSGKRPLGRMKVAACAGR